MLNTELNVLTEFLKSNNYGISYELLELQFLSHPQKSTLGSFTDTLDYFAIDNAAIELPLERFSELKNPFIAHVVIQDQAQFVLIKPVNNESVILFDGKVEHYIKSVDFFKTWQRVAIVIDKHKKKIRLTSNDVFIGVLLLSISIPFVVGLPIVSSLFSILCMAGGLISLLILQKELGFKNRISEKFCSALENSGCNTLINSGIKLPFGLRFSDASLVYFILLFFQVISQNYNLVKFLGALSVPVILFSILYQGLIVKEWCRLCLGIVGILTFQLALNFLYFKQKINFDKSYIVYGLAFIILTVIVQILKDELKKVSGIKSLKLENLKFRRNTDLFIAYYNSQLPIDTLLPNATPEIILGQSDALINLVAITNPMCQPCSLAHQTYHTLLKKYDDKISLKIRFYVPVEDHNDPRLDIAVKLLMLDKKLQSRYEMGEILHTWFTDKKLPSQVNNLDKSAHATEFIDAIKIYRKWCENYQIDVTPTLLINGRLFSTNYQIEDIENFLDDLILQEELRTTNNAYLSSYNI